MGSAGAFAKSVVVALAVAAALVGHARAAEGGSEKEGREDPGDVQGGPPQVHSRAMSPTVA